MNIGFYIEALFHDNYLSEGVIAAILLAYVLSVVYGTKLTYSLMRSKGMPHNVAVYYNRKLIHILAGGVVALLVPIVFTGALIPLILALILALLTYLPHKSGRLMYWFQVEDNMYEVNFCLMWAIVITLSWLIFKTPIYGVLPISFMAFGDAVTGIVRNALFKRRTKHWIGNLAMLSLSLPLGLYFAGISGAIAGAVASIVEKFERNPIDDNVLISLTSFTILLISGLLGML